MASLSGSHYSFFAQNENVNLVATPDGKNLPPPVAQEFNLELILSLSGPTVVPAGYQRVALMSSNGRILDLANGDIGVRDTGTGSDTIIAGAGNDTIYSGKGTNLIVGGSGADSIDGSASGGVSITAGAGPATIRGGGHGSILGGAGPATIIGGIADSIRGGSGAMSVDGGAGREQIVAGSGPSTITAAQKDVVTAGSGNTTIDLGGGPVTLNLGSGVATVVDVGIKSTATVTGFDQVGGDRLSFAGETAASIQHVVATAQSTPHHTTVTFPDGTTMTLIGISHINSAFFK
jgi:Ca2+-binding RTX toxin-like protein